MTRDGLKCQLGSVAKAALDKWEVDSRNTASGEYRDRAVAVGDAILAAIEAAGVRLVPVEADKPMLKAAIDNAPMTLIKEQPTGLRRARYGWSDAECAEVYTAMLAASPYAPKEQTHESD